VRVEFGSGITFTTAPIVVTSFAGIDALSPKTKRFSTFVSDVTALGFRLHVKSWADSVTWSVEVTWVATSEPAHVQMGTEAFGDWPHRKVSDNERRHTQFPSSFSCAPDVVLGMALVDSEGDEQLFLRSESAEVTCRGFSMRCGSLSNSDTWGTTVAWFASASPAALQASTVELGGGPEDPICKGKDKTLEVRFPRAFDSAPKVVLALAGFDIDCTKPLRIHSWADDVREDGFRVNVRTWEGSVTSRVQLTWIATPVGATATKSLVTEVPPHYPPQDYVVEGNALGQGWWGVTHRAKHKGDGRIYAVKTCKHPFRKHEEFLRQELQNLARLPDHQNLLRYYACVIQDDRLHIVTEFIDAFKLTELVPSCDGPFPRKHVSATVLRWMAQLFDGLAHMHKVGMVHRDLHGENVLVSRDILGAPSQGPGAVRIIDFGVAKVYDVMRPRHMSVSAGCWQYFSPERRKGAEFDDRDDVWAAGCHLTELVSGRYIKNRKGCGLDGVDFATTPACVSEAIGECGYSNSRCRQLAEAVLIKDRHKRPGAGTARDLILGQLLHYTPGKRSGRSGLGPSGGSRRGRLQSSFT